MWSDEGVERPAWFVVTIFDDYSSTWWFSNRDAAQRAADKWRQGCSTQRVQ